ncbi:proteasome subunit [Theileria orientalis]|uniref:Proteasome subunit n=1 Tax=Theileria orientalis TaxID=68886 RepID=A0A976MDQ7_THEOR|nr:proteasome subunit [Theileria orientalis]
MLVKRPEEGFNPYVNNGGTVIAATWKNYAVIAADTRLSLRYLIHTRYSTKLLKLTDKCILGTSGMQADMLALQSVIERQIEMYRFSHHKEPTFGAIAQLLSTVLYGRRFFPYYTFNILCGLDENGNGVTCNYDAVGNYNYEKYAAQGTSSSLVVPILDSLLNGNNQQVKPQINSLEDLVNLVKNAMVSAVERDICTGDSAELVVCDGVVHEPVKMELRVD